jgi:hypothetical protein
MFANLTDHPTPHHSEPVGAIVKPPMWSTDARRCAPATNSGPPRPAPPTEVGRSLNVRPHSVNDPYNYLG